MIRESNKWEKVTAFSTAALAGLALVTLVVAYRQILEFRSEAQAQHLAEVVNQFDNGPVSLKLHVLAAKRIDQKRQVLKSLDIDAPPMEMYDLLDFFEYVALLTNRGYLDKNDVWEILSFPMFNVYADARPLLNEEQKSDPSAYAGFSSLMADMQQIEASKNRGVDDHPSQDDIYGFYLGAFETNSGAPPARGPRKRNMHP